MAAPPRSRIASSTGGLVLLAGTQFVIAVDFTIVYVALPTIGHSLDMAPKDLQWVITAYGLPFGGFLLLAGRAADLVGRRTVFVTGHAVFGLSSAVAALSPEPAVLVAARACQGVGAAMLAPSTVALLHALFGEGEQRNRAVGIWGAAGASGGAVGVVAGGAISDAVGWSWIFLGNVPLSLGMMLLASRWLPADPARRRVDAGDVAGALAVTGGSLLLIHTIGLGAQAGLAARQTLLSAGGAAVLLLVFAVVERRDPDPLVPLTLLRTPTLVVAAAIALAFHGSLNNQLYLLTLHLQDVLGWSALSAGLWFVPHCLCIAVGTTVGARLVTRWGVRVAGTTGMAAGGVGVLVAATAVGDRFDGVRLLIGLAVSGLGQGATWPAFWAAATIGVVDSDQGVVGGIVSTVSQLGQAVGLAVIAAVVASTASGSAAAGSGQTDALRGGIQLALLGVAAVAGLGAAVAARLPRGPRTAAGVSDPAARGRR